MFSIGDKVVENVRQFVYLAHMISNMEDGCFTELHISRAVGKFSELKNVLSDRNVNMATRRKIYDLDWCMVHKHVSH